MKAVACFDVARGPNIVCVQKSVEPLVSFFAINVEMDKSRIFMDSRKFTHHQRFGGAFEVCLNEFADKGFCRFAPVRAVDRRKEDQSILRVRDAGLQIVERLKPFVRFNCLQKVARCRDCHPFEHCRAWFRCQVPSVVLPPIRGAHDVGIFGCRVGVPETRES